MKTNKYIAIAALQAIIFTQSACAQAQTQPVMQPQAKQSIQLKDGEHYVIERVEHHINDDVMLQLKGVNTGLYAHRKPEIKIELKKTKKIKNFLNQYPELKLVSEENEQVIIARVSPKKLVNIWYQLSDDSAVLNKELMRYEPQVRLR